jgi:hypothetical protein
MCTVFRPLDVYPPIRFCRGEGGGQKTKPAARDADEFVTGRSVRASGFCLTEI